jgi:tRNA-dihydrouridine synthase 4
MLDERYSNPTSAQEFDDTPEPRGIHGRAKRQRKVRGKLIIQFAANDPVHLADAAELASPFVDAIDLNCGEFLSTLDRSSILDSGSSI